MQFTWENQCVSVCGVYVSLVYQKPNTPEIMVYIITMNTCGFSQQQMFSSSVGIVKQ